MVDLYAWSMIIFVSELFGLDISLGVGGHKTHELRCSGDTFTAEMIMLILGSDRGRTYHRHYSAYLCSYSVDIPTGLPAPQHSSGGCRYVESSREFCPKLCQRASADTQSTDRSREQE